MDFWGRIRHWCLRDEGLCLCGSVLSWAVLTLHFVVSCCKNATVFLKIAEHLLSVISLVLRVECKMKLCFISPFNLLEPVVQKFPFLLLALNCELYHLKELNIKLKIPKSRRTGSGSGGLLLCFVRHKSGNIDVPGPNRKEHKNRDWTSDTSTWSCDLKCAFLDP